MIGIEAGVARNPNGENVESAAAETLNIERPKRGPQTDRGPLAPRLPPFDVQCSVFPPRRIRRSQDTRKKVYVREKGV